MNNDNEHPLTHLPLPRPNTTDFLVREITQVVINDATPIVISRTQRRIFTLQGISWLMLFLLVLLFLDLRHKQLRQENSHQEAVGRLNVLTGRMDEHRTTDAERLREGDSREQLLRSSIQQQAAATQQGQAEIRGTLDLVYGTRRRLDAVQDSFGTHLGVLASAVNGFGVSRDTQPGEGSIPETVLHTATLRPDEPTPVAGTPFVVRFATMGIDGLEEFEVRNRNGTRIVGPVQLHSLNALSIRHDDRIFRLWLSEWSQSAAGTGLVRIELAERKPKP